MTPAEKQKIIDEMVKNVKKHHQQYTDEQAKAEVDHWVQILDKEIDEDKRENNSKFFDKLKKHDLKEGTQFAKSIKNWWDELLDDPNFYRCNLSSKVRSLKIPKNLSGNRRPEYVILTNHGIRTNKELKKILNLTDDLTGFSGLRLTLSNVYENCFK